MCACMHEIDFLNIIIRARFQIFFHVRILEYKYAHKNTGYHDSLDCSDLNTPYNETMSNGNFP